MSTGGPITLLLAEDHRVVRAGLRLLLDRQDGIEVIGEAGDIAETELRAAELRPRVIVLDVDMPDGSSIPAIPRLQKIAPGTRIVILTMHTAPALARDALRAGATGFVLKDAAEAELLDAIRAAAAGRTYLNPELGAQLAAEGPDARRAPRRPVGARARGARADRARAHQRRDRLAAVPERAHRRVPSRAHPAEDADGSRAPSSSPTRASTASAEPGARSALSGAGPRGDLVAPRRQGG